MLKNKSLMLIAVGLFSSMTLASCNFRSVKAGNGVLDDTLKIKSEDPVEELEEEISEEESKEPEEADDFIYDITWKNYDDTELKKTTANWGELPVYGETLPTKPDEGNYEYIFDGWNPELTNAVKDTTYTAKFKRQLKVIKVNWLKEDGTSLSCEDYQKGEIISAVTAPAKEAVNGMEYVFDYWYDDVNGNIPTSALDGTVAEYNFKPHYKEVGFTVTFQDFDGTEIKKVTGIERNKKFSDPRYSSLVPTDSFMAAKANAMENDRYTYSFAGWAFGQGRGTALEKNDDGIYPEGATATEVCLTDFKNTFTVTENQTFHAVYRHTQKKYTVKFYGKDNTELLGTLSDVNYGSIVSFTGNGFTNPSNYDVENTEATGVNHFTFDGTFKHKVGDNWVNGFSYITGNTDYYANYSSSFEEYDTGDTYFTSESGAFSVKIEKISDSVGTFNKLEYKKNNGTWTGYTIGEDISGAAADKIYFRGTGNTGFGAGGGLYDFNNHGYHLSLTGSDIKWKGIADNLLDYQKVANNESYEVANYAFAYFAGDQKNLIEGPSFNFKNAPQYCFLHTFENCTALTKIGDDTEFTSADKGAFAYMFFNDGKFVTAPKFNLTELKDEIMHHCFYYTKISSMEGSTFTSTNGVGAEAFNAAFNTTNITETPVFHVEGALARSAFSSCFASCYALKKVNITGNITSCGNNGASGMFCYAKITEPLTIFNCTSTDHNSFNDMYYYCSLIKISETQDATYTMPIKFPNNSANCDSNYSTALTDMLISTGGSFTGTPVANQTYYYAPAA